MTDERDNVVELDAYRDAAPGPLPSYQPRSDAEIDEIAIGIDEQTIHTTQHDGAQASDFRPWLMMGNAQREHWLQQGIVVLYEYVRNAAPSRTRGRDLDARERLSFDTCNMLNLEDWRRVAAKLEQIRNL